MKAKYLFKKSLLAVASLALAVAVPLCASAEYINNSEIEADELGADFSEYSEMTNPNTVFYNDMESVYGEYKGAFTIGGTGDPEHGSAIIIPAIKSWVGMNPASTLTDVKYKFRGKELSFLNEAYEADTYYIGKYDHKAKYPYEAKIGDSFSFCPGIPEFYVERLSDNRMTPQNSAEWSTAIFGFNSDTAGTLNLRANNYGSNCTVFIDNVRLIKATTLSIDSDRISINPIYGSVFDKSDTYNKTGKNLVELGAPLRFTLESLSATTKVAGVYMDGKEILPHDGVYTIYSITAPISVESEYSMPQAPEKYKTANGNIYVDYGTTALEFMNESGINRNDAEAYEKSGNKAALDCKLQTNGKITYLYSGSSKDTVNFKVKGDINSDGVVSVTDIVSLVSDIITSAPQDDMLCSDMDGNDTISVTDVVRIRQSVLSENRVANIDTSTLENMESAEQALINEAAESGVNVTDEMINRSVYNTGNRAKFADVIAKAANGEEITICYFGGSITQGGNASAEMVTNSGYVSRLSTWFKNMFPQTNINTINAGYGGTDTVFGVYRFQNDVLRYNPDIIIVEFCCNDDNKNLFKQSTYEAVTRKAIESGAATMLLSFEQPDVKLDSSQEMHEPISDFYNLPMISYRDAFEAENFFNYYDSTNKGKVSSDGIHPNTCGYALSTLILEDFFKDIYENQSAISSRTQPLPSATVNHNTTSFNSGCAIANIGTDLKAAGDSVALSNGIKITLNSLGSFNISDEYMSKVDFPGEINGTKITNYNSTLHYYYGAEAEYSETPEPIEFTIENVSFIDLLRLRNDKCTYADILIDGEKVAFDYANYGARNTWASDPVFETDNPVTVNLKIMPDLKTEETYNVMAIMVN